MCRNPAVLLGCFLLLALCLHVEGQTVFVLRKRTAFTAPNDYCVQYDAALGLRMATCDITNSNQHWQDLNSRLYHRGSSLYLTLGPATTYTPMLSASLGAGQVVSLSAADSYNANRFSIFVAATRCLKAQSSSIGAALQSDTLCSPSDDTFNFQKIYVCLTVAPVNTLRDLTFGLPWPNGFQCPYGVMQNIKARFSDMGVATPFTSAAVSCEGFCVQGYYAQTPVYCPQGGGAGGLWNTQVGCAACRFGGPAYDCGVFNRRVNQSPCSGAGGDTNDCVACSNSGGNGVEYRCPQSQYLTGSPCSGTTNEDSQSCTGCYGGAQWNCGTGYRRQSAPPADFCSGTTIMDTQLCTQCNNGVFSPMNQFVSYTCPTGLYKIGATCAGLSSEDTQTCELCNIPMPGCLTCTVNNFCTLCGAGYFRNIANTCTACTPACDLGSQYERTPCDPTVPAGAGNPGNRVCRACNADTANCQTCTKSGSTSSCNSCSAGRYWTGSMCQTCTPCAANQYETQPCVSVPTTNHDRSCATCNMALAPNCRSPADLRCTSATLVTCAVCRAGFYLQGGQCFPCNTEHCAAGLTCTNGNNAQCQQCDFGYYLVANPGGNAFCIACEPVEFCLPGVNWCDDYDTPKCDQCDSHHYPLDIDSPTNPGMGLLAQQCAACVVPLHCAVSPVTCTFELDAYCPQCEQGFYLTTVYGFGDQSCVACEACGAGTYESQPCTGTDWSDTHACTPCTGVAGCAQVTCTGAGSSTCQQCLAGYTLQVDGSCVATACTPITGCTSVVTCTTPTDSHCAQCATGKYLRELPLPSACPACTPVPNCAVPVTCSSDANQFCAACAVGSFHAVLGGHSVCTPCTSVAFCQGQVTCTNALDSVCSTCMSGYWRDDTSVPATCNECTWVEHCLSSVTCASAFDSQCTACESPGYFLTTAGSASVCLACTPVAHCADTALVCTSFGDSQCSVCASAYYLEQSQPADRCLGCTAIAQCTQPAGCTAVDTSQCTTCQNGYWLQQGTADSCPKCSDIDNCLSAETCTTAANSVCTTCNTGYYRSGAPAGSQLQCQPCAPVAHCNPGYPITCNTATNSQCTVCEAGYWQNNFLPSTTCEACTPITGCTNAVTLCTSDVNSQCTTCAPGRYLVESEGLFAPDTCPTCPAVAHCVVAVTCSAAETVRCAQCAPGYYLHDNGVFDTCEPCSAVEHCALPSQLTCTSMLDSYCVACEQPGYHLEILPNGGTRCLDCLAVANCAVTPTCTTGADSQCGECMVGNWLSNGLADACLPCVCAVGEFVAACAVGATSPPTCQACAACAAGFVQTHACAGNLFVDDHTCAPCGVAHCTSYVSACVCGACETPGFVVQNGVCVPAMCSVASLGVNGASQTTSCSTAVAVGDVCTVGCAAGYSGTAVVRTCVAANTFDSANPTCTLDACSQASLSLSAGQIAAATCAFPTAVAGSCAVECAVGYSGTAVVRTCSGANTWSAANPTCTQITCSQASLALSTGQSTSCQFPTPYGSACTVACASGYTGSAVQRTCNAANTWSAANPTCTPVSTDPNACAVNNGGCGEHANCWGGLNGAAVGCTCHNGYFKDASNVCVGVNMCATNNGGCDAAHGVCTPVIGSWTRTCTCAVGWNGPGANGYYCPSVPVDRCQTANGGCDANAACYNGFATPPTAVTCVCLPGFATNPSASGPSLVCVGVNVCATANGGCHADALCTSAVGSWEKVCTCKANFTGNGYFCTADTGNPGSGSNTPGWDCPSPPTSFWDWRYAPPTCTALTVEYPVNLPVGQANDVNVRLHTANGDVTLNFHNNTGFWSGTTVFALTAHASFPWGQAYSVVWTSVSGTNCHWTGNLACSARVDAMMLADVSSSTVAVSTSAGVSLAFIAFAACLLLRRHNQQKSNGLKERLASEHDQKPAAQAAAAQSASIELSTVSVTDAPLAGVGPSSSVASTTFAFAATSPIHSPIHSPSQSHAQGVDL